MNSEVKSNHENAANVQYEEGLGIIEIMRRCAELRNLRRNNRTRRRSVQKPRSSKMPPKPPQAVDSRGGIAANPHVAETTRWFGGLFD
jgi:hypothetical protein